MYKNNTSIIPYDNIDLEIRDLVKYINNIDGVETTECCFGHNENPCMIYFKVESIEILTKFLFNFFDCENLWHIEIDVADVDKHWNDIHLVLHSGNIKDYPTINLMVDNLTYRFEKKING